jgi:hypothetical protein
LIRPWIIRQRALHPLQSWRGGLARGRHVGLSASSREGTLLKAAPIVVCARTSLAAVTTRKPAPCMRATASRHVGWRAQGSRHTSGANASCSTYRMVVALCGSGSGGWRATPAFLCRRHRLRRQLKVSGGGDGPRRITGMRGRNIESAHRHRAAPTILRLHQTYRSCVERRTATSLQTR